MSDDRRIAIVANTTSYVGPDLARALARRGHDLVVGDPAEGLVDELTGMGATVEVVTGVHDLGKPEAAPALVQAAIDRFGRIDSAVAASGRIVVGRFLKSGIDDLRAAVRGCLEAPYHFLRVFKQAHSVTPCAFLRRLRLERAMALLDSTTLPVGEIAARVGLSRLALWRGVRALRGTPPREGRCSNRSLVHAVRTDSPA